MKTLVRQEFQSISVQTLKKYVSNPEKVFSEFENFILEVCNFFKIIATSFKFSSAISGVIVLEFFMYSDIFIPVWTSK